MRNQGLAVALLAALAGLFPGRSAGERIGLFFDAAASSCAATIEPFGPCRHVYVYAFPPAATPVSGALLRLRLPADIDICLQDPVAFPRDLVFADQGTLLDGLDLSFRSCVTGSAPLLLAEFGVYDKSLQPGPRPDLVLQLVGAPHDSLTNPRYPQLKVCDPADPQHYLGLLDAPPVDATLNCTQRCGCTTALEPRAWTAIKLLYRGR